MCKKKTLYFAILLLSMFTENLFTHHNERTGRFFADRLCARHGHGARREQRLCGRRVQVSVRAVHQHRRHMRWISGYFSCQFVLFAFIIYMVGRFVFNV